MVCCTLISSSTVSQNARSCAENRKLIIRALFGRSALKDHFSFVSELAPGIPQFVTGGGYEGCAREITIL